MSFINTYIFKAELSKTAIMDFIARTPPELFLMASSGQFIYGILMTDEVAEYFTNEFKIITFEIIQPQELKKVLSIPGCKVWGNWELLNL
jgi:hypothetical protein